MQGVKGQGSGLCVIRGSVCGAMSQARTLGALPAARVHRPTERLP
jgi:hypothetical protein